MKQNILKTRESNYDVLRILCSLAVIAIHISATYKAALTNGDSFGNYHTESMLTILLFNTLSRFSIPCFVMLSGAFLVADNRNADFKYFYKKSIKNIFVHVIIMSLIIYADSQIVVIYHMFSGNHSLSYLVSPLVKLISGKPWMYMWYMYMLAGVYAVIPILVMLKNKISNKAFAITSWIYFVIAVLSGWTSTMKLEWSIAKVACYLGFIFVGYQLRNKSSKNNIHAIILIVTGFISQLAISYFQYQNTLNGINTAYEKLSIISDFNPIVVFSSVLVFAGFSKIDIKANRFSNLSRHTFYIYLLHPIAWNVLTFLVGKIFGCLPKAEYFIPISIVVVFIFSYFMSLVYNAIVKKFSEKICLVDKILDKF